MPVSFDFVNDGTFAVTNASAPPPITSTDTDDAGGGQTVTFTVSSDAAGGTAQVVFGNANFVGVPLSLNDDGSVGGSAANDVWTLTFEDTANPDFTRLSGTESNQLALQIGSVAIGSIRVELLNGTSVLRSALISGDNTNSTIQLGIGSINGIRFTTLTDGFDAVYLTGLSANALNCFLTGTGIATPEGKVAVEDLREGDRVMTSDGRAVEVTWVGHRRVETRMASPRVNPICISADALSTGVPERDLYVSPDHAIGIEGCLVNASVLVNGETIYQVAQMPLEGFTYYHIETDAHELLLAEGCPAESYIDQGDAGFDNARERKDRTIPEMDLPRIASARMLPDVLKARLQVSKRDVAA